MGGGVLEKLHLWAQWGGSSPQKKNSRKRSKGGSRKGRGSNIATAGAEPAVKSNPKVSRKRAEACRKKGT